MLTQPTFRDDATTLLGKIAQSLYQKGLFLTVINDEKLALTGISVGQVVHVSDAVSFKINGTFRFFDFAVQGGFGDGSTKNGRPNYGVDAGGDGEVNIYWTGTGSEFEDPNKWKFHYTSNDSADSDISNELNSYSDSDVAAPNLATGWYQIGAPGTPINLIVINPAVQHYLGGGANDETHWST